MEVATDPLRLDNVKGWKRKWNRADCSKPVLFHGSWSDLPTRHWKATDMSRTLDSSAVQSQKEECSTGRSGERIGKGLGSTKRNPGQMGFWNWECKQYQWTVGSGSPTLSTCSKFSSLPWSWFLSQRAKSLSCVTTPRASLSWAYSDFTCTQSERAAHLKYVFHF